jgi:hypothetical protein
MTRRPPSDSDPARWIDRGAGTRAEDLAGSGLRQARELPLPPTIPFGRLRLMSRRRHRPAFLLARVAAILIFGAGLGAGASGGWLVRSLKRARGGDSSESRLDVPAGAVVRLRRAGRWRMALGGPGSATVTDVDKGTVRLVSGTLTIAAEAEPVAVEVGGERVRLGPGGVARVGMTTEGQADAVTVAGDVEVLSTRASTHLSTHLGSEGERQAAWSALDGTPSTPALAVATVPDKNAEEARTKAPARVESNAETEPHVAAVAVPEPTARQRLAPAPLAAPPLAGATDSESAWLSRALVSLRRDGDPGAALALLDEYAARFPRGTLRAEALATRVEALLARGDGAAARAILEELPAPGAPLDRRLQVLRGELRAQSGDCAEATRDFTQTLGATTSDALDERALRGQAACAALSHDDTALGEALDRYLSRFPHGPFAEEARLRRQTRGERP